MNEPITCPECNGEKKILGYFPVYAEGHTGPRSPVIEMNCPTCNGDGSISKDQSIRITRGREFRNRRKELGYGLRDFADRIGMSPIEWSAMEQGRAEPVWPDNSPPKREATP